MGSKATSKDDAVFQAVVVADNFNVCSSVFEESWALLPLAGARTIDYTLEFLLHAGVTEVIIYCVRQADLVKKHVKKNWIDAGVVFNVVFLSTESCHSVGDVMRDIDSKALIKSDFLLVQAGVVSNCDIKAVLSTHKARRVRDNRSVLTLTFAECDTNHSNRSRITDFCAVLQTDTGQLLRHNKFGKNIDDIKIPMDVISLNDNLTTRFDLVDGNIAICSTQIPPLFSDNFDIQTLHHLTQEILANEEVLAYKIYVHILTNRYAMYIRDFHSYIAANQNLMERWCFPHVPESVTNADAVPHYVRRFRNVYVSPEVKKISKSAHLEKNVIVGENTEIGDNTKIINTVMGRNCVIGNNCILRNSILWDNVTIKDGCVVDSSILCNKTILHDSVRICERCVLGQQIIVPSKAIVEPGSVVRSESAPKNSNLVSVPYGIVSKSFLWHAAGKDGAPNEALWPRQYPLIIEDTATISDTDAPEVENKPQNTREDRIPDALVAAGGDAEYQTFFDEVLESLVRGFEENIDCANLIMEINSSKHAYNVPVSELQKYVMTAMIQTPFEVSSLQVDNSANLAKSYQPVLKYFLPLMKNYFIPKSGPSKAAEKIQINCLTAIQEFARAKPLFAETSPRILLFMFNEELLEEEVLVRWHSTLSEPLKNKLHTFIQWIQEAEEESSDDE